ncbi:CoA transferase [Antarctobacter sp.]|uniref:CoA transferase n=1 Tax=Antarctobacter sp. TaxID=1872577 RepID=UPI003A903AA4
MPRKAPEGRRALEGNVAEADAVMTNLYGDPPGQLGLTHPGLKHVKEDLGCLHVSAYGQGNSRGSCPWPRS